MKFWIYIIKSLRFYWRAYLGVFLGTIISTAILVGALLVGDSVKYSLNELALSRLGKTEFVLVTGERFVRKALADELSDSLNAALIPALQLDGIAIKEGGIQRVNQVQVYGIEDGFWNLWAGENKRQAIGPDQAAINQQLASRLNLALGEELLIRVEKVDALPQDVPLSTRERSSIAFRLTIGAIIPDETGGRFSLRANQNIPYNIFLNYDFLSQKMELPDRINLILFPENITHIINEDKLNSLLKHTWKLSDASLKVQKTVSPNRWELKSDRIFIDSALSRAALNVNSKSEGIFTYFVNQFRVGKRTSPYSFIAASGAPLVPADLAADEIIINEWLANDLGIQKGAELEIQYYVLHPLQKLEEKSTKFRVRQVVPIQGFAADKTLMPDFPGFANAESCSDWEPGIPINLDLIRKKDEAYWNEYRGTPKAFISLETAQKLWSNRFGNLTAIRFPMQLTESEIENRILDQIEPASLGFVVQPVRENSLQASSEAVDFGQLFLGLSFFIIVAALLLTGLLYSFSIELRAKDTGVLLALGFTEKQVKTFLLTEGAIIASVGSFGGIFLGLFYNQFIIWALETIWQGAVGTSALQSYYHIGTLLIGFFAGLAMAVLAIWITVRKQLLHPITELQQADLISNLPSPQKKLWLISFIFILMLTGALLITILGISGKVSSATGAFFGAGAMLLIGLLAFLYILLIRQSRSSAFLKTTLPMLGFRNLIRRYRRSLATISILACGIFSLIAVSANQQGLIQNPRNRQAGTGGFSLYAETSIPVLSDLNSSEGRQYFGLSNTEYDDVRFVQMHVREGDDASCLNLNRVHQPQILGVKPEELDSRKAFSFSQLSSEFDSEHPWLGLNHRLDHNVIPAIADQTVIIWGFGKSIGDTLEFIDENGQRLKLRLIGGLANSIFQGNVLIADKFFLEHFPSISGSKLFLTDVPEKKEKALFDQINQNFHNYGIDLNTTANQLARFNIVQNTYLSIFLALGGLGLILGTVGLGIVVLRNVLERRGELAVLRAVGFSRPMLRQLIFTEHSLLLAGGFLVGTVAALFAILPMWFTMKNEIPFIFLFLTLLAVVMSGIAWTWAATQLALRGNLLTAIRNE
ncbi:FtsX-like permease family protein [candidate division KSB1 bacterium]|nr:FtsX-like permease family protein [candidate division KSB1 bacterium]